VLEYINNYLPGYGRINDRNQEEEAANRFIARHCYVIAGNRLGHHENPDENEILIWDAVVIAQIF